MKKKRRDSAAHYHKLQEEGYEIVAHPELHFELLMRKDGDTPLADIVPGAWASRAAEAVDLEADGYVTRLVMLCGNSVT